MGASWVAMNLPQQCAGLVLLSGCSPNSRLPEPRMAVDVSKTPVLYFVGSDDVQMRPSTVRRCVEDLRQRGFDVDFHELPHLGHEVNEIEAEHILNFLHKVLPEQPAETSETVDALSYDIHRLGGEVGEEGSFHVR